MKVKKIPMRKCVACGKNIPKKDLIRIIHNKEEGILIDPSGKKNGRGAYLCKTKECIEQAKKNKNLNRALKSNVDDEIYKELLNDIDPD